MKTTKKQLLLTTLLTGAIAITSSAAVAQDSSSSKKDEDKIIVTGSRIARKNVVAAQPVVQIDRSDLLATGITDVGDLVQSLPSTSGSPIGTTTNNGGNGAVNVDLRGLGVNRTLVLIDGHRTIDQGDFQTIPSLMIKRLEILKSGASATYGADAVSGVVNVITRDDFTGFEVTAQHSIWDKTNGAAQSTIGAIAGKEFGDDGHVIFGAEYVKQDEAYQGDTPWAFMQDSFYIYPEGCEAQVAAPYTGLPSGGCYPYGSSRIPESRIRLGDGQGTWIVGTPASQSYQAGLLAPYDGRNYNYAPVNYLQTPYEKLNVFANGKFALNNNVDFHFSIRGNHRTSAQELAPMPYNSGTDPAYDGIFNGTAYHGISQDNYYLRQAIDLYNATNPTTPLTYAPAIDVRRRMIEIPRRFEQTVDQIQSNVSLTGSWKGIDWEWYGGYGTRTRSDQDYGQFSGTQLANAMGPSADLNGDGQPECYTDINDPTTLIAGCVPFNFFGGGSVVRATGEITATSVTQDMLDYVSATLNDTTKSDFASTGFGASGEGPDAFGAGAIGWAAGVGYWRRSAAYIPDSQKVLGTVTGNKGAGTSGELENLNVYAELNVPLYDNGTQNVNLNTAARYDTFTNIDDGVTYQVGLQAQVIPALMLRGAYNTVFRVPTIGELYSGQGDSFPTAQDPCAAATPAQYCAQQSVQLDSQLLTSVGGNPDLKAEKGDSITAGFVFTPDLSSMGLGNLSLTVDYYRINLDDGINTLGANQIMKNCYVDNIQEACALITRRPDYSILRIIDINQNLSNEKAEGVDTELRWAYDAGFADFKASVLWSHTLKREFTLFAGDTPQDLTGRFAGNSTGQAYPDDKANLMVSAARGNFTLTYRGEYISGLGADTFCNCGAGNEPDGSYTQHVPAQYYSDVVLGIDVPSYGVTLTGGVTNVTNEAPPFIETGFNGGTDPSTYRLFGRGFFLRASKKF